MAADVIDFKLCGSNYNCQECSFDKAMDRVAKKNEGMLEKGLKPTGKKAGIISWQEKLLKTPRENTCRHSLVGRVPNRICPNSYECNHCDFDQMLEDAWEMQLPTYISTSMEVEGYNLPEKHFFHKGHAWARVEDSGRIRVGLDDFVTKAFKGMDSLELPLMGQEVKSGEKAFAFKRKGKEAYILSPVSGIVVASNYAATKDITSVKEEPYNQGWMMVIEPTDMKKELKELLYGSETTEWMQEEHKKITKNPKMSWEKKAEEFLYN